MKFLLRKKSTRLPEDHSRRLRRTSYRLRTSTQSRLLTRIWVEVALGFMSAILLALTILLPDWMEMLVGLAPDAGDGSAEWGLTLSCATVAVLMFGFAGRTWRKYVQLLQKA